MKRKASKDTKRLEHNHKQKAEHEDTQLEQLTEELKTLLFDRLLDNIASIVNIMEQMEYLETLRQGNSGERYNEH